MNVIAMASMEIVKYLQVSQFMYWLFIPKYVY